MNTNNSSGGIIERGVTTHLFDPDELMRLAARRLAARRLPRDLTPEETQKYFHGLDPKAAD